MFRLAALLTLGTVSALAPLPGQARDGANFNGAWSVDLVTESGMVCDSRYSYSVSVQEGQVRLVSGQNASLSGRVGPDGTVGLSVTNGTATGAVSGRLQATSGGGTWKVSSLCSGRWTARRHTTRTAQAE
ncbi:MAG: hypothetical protein Q7T93_06975 [Methylobacterium sp.]|jgi:hypothetical protein|uniref:hypothetical protein n=1 Tax=unclassified Methylobacterium TaxID=2615210 RepID=UPI0006F6BB42|nr:MULTISPECIES: hypothetical protein [unclassified Methylobacterium]KQP10813.1 hypothetical protein ASF28_06880 [Methylobacterium sp. Leaf99]MDO9426560.1 hypothetical protein [Methylobacterium sp.]TXM70799.1 hypothetical protein FV218_15915 [Methylobacterium sp. WL69]